MAPLQNPSFEPKTHRWRPGAGAPSREVPSQNCAFVPQNSLFWPKTVPEPAQNGQTKGNRLYTSRAPRLPLDKELFVALQLHDMSQKRPKNGQKWPECALLLSQTQNQERAVSWATWLKTEFRAHLFHPQPPTFCGFQASESPNETRRPPYQWSLGGAGGQHIPRTLGANGGSIGVPGAKKIIFFKVVHRPLGMLKHVFLARFEPVVARYAPWKIPKCLENGPFQDQKSVKNGSKAHFSKSDPGPLGMLKQVRLAHFEPVVTRFGPWKIPNCLENGSFWDRKWGQNGPNTRFSKSIHRPFGMLGQVFLPHFEPIGIGFGPWKMPKCLENGLFSDQKSVNNESKTHFSKCDCGPFGVHEHVESLEQELQQWCGVFGTKWDE